MNYTRTCTLRINKNKVLFLNMYNNKVSPALFFLVLIAGTTLLPVTKGKICIEDFGPNCSGGDCETKCESKHKNGLGDCDVGESCKCYYDCEAKPPRKLCKSDLGLYPRGCAAQQCQKDCENELPGCSKDDDHGYCYDHIYPDQSFRCIYFCPIFR